jgi:hypothetical protein
MGLKPPSSVEIYWIRGAQCRLPASRNATDAERPPFSTSFGAGRLLSTPNVPRDDTSRWLIWGTENSSLVASKQ